MKLDFMLLSVCTMMVHEPWKSLPELPAGEVKTPLSEASAMYIGIQVHMHVLCVYMGNVAWRAGTLCLPSPPA